MGKVSDVMTRGVRTLTPDDTLLQAAQAMESLDVGVIPVCDGERLVGLVTDRDLVLRGLAQGYPADTTRLDGLITRQVQCCHEDDALEDVLQKMGTSTIRRMPVLDHEHRLVGMVTLGDVAAKADSADSGKAGQALSEISQPTGPEHAGQPRATGTTRGGIAEDPSQQASS
ncbi:CBS domain-containing protein [Roseateles sp. DB2]|uniref:CBS domain-containing protein n=1 Tax=Roseateles sp. DB2 TaxID=3453717 RepID=UPI003EE8D210